MEIPILLDLKKRQKFLELKKKYGFEIAVLKQSDVKASHDEELYKSLLLFDVQNQIVDSISAYAEAVDYNSAELASLVTMLFNSTGEIIANIARQDPGYVLLSREIAINQFDKHIKDILDGKST